MADIFISYAQSDRDWVSRLASTLRAHGFSVWWDPEMLAGKRVDKIVHRELAAAKAVIVVWSNRSIESPWVLGEADEAMSLEKLTPIKIQRVPLPTQFRSIHTPDLSEWNGSVDDPCLESLLRGIRDIAEPGGERSAPSNTPPLPPPSGAMALRNAGYGFTVLGATLVLVGIGGLGWLVTQHRATTVPTLQTIPAPSIKADSADPVRRGLNGHVADAVAKAEKFEIDAHEQAANAVVVVDQAQDAVPKARDAAKTANDSTQQGYTLDFRETAPNGETASYSGEVDDRKLQNGDGVMNWRGGDHYEGEWSRGHRAGFGTFYYSKKNQYGQETETGRYENGEINGLGRSTWRNGAHYLGQFVDGIPTGLGVETLANGETQAGQYSNWALEGFGVISLADKSRWIGQFHKSQLNGYAAKFDSRGRLIEQGVYEDGKLEQALLP